MAAWQRVSHTDTHACTKRLNWFRVIHLMFNLKSSIRLTKKLFFFCVIHLMVSISNFLQGACERIEQNQTKGISNYPIISIQKYAYLWQTLTISLPYKHLTTFETLLYFYNKFINFFQCRSFAFWCVWILKSSWLHCCPRIWTFFLQQPLVAGLLYT